MALENVADLKAQIKGLKKVVGKPALRRIARAGAVPIRTEARRLLKEKTKGRTGKLAGAIQSFEQRDREQGVAIVHVKPTKHAFFLKFVEFGTKPHVIPKIGKKLRHRKAMVFTIGGITYFAKSVQHPGARAFPFLGPAYANTKQEAFDEMDKRAKGEITVSLK